MSERIVPQMPTLLKEEMDFHKHNNIDTRFGGESAEHCVKYMLMHRGINFYKPAVDDGVDLLVLGEGGVLKKGQIKKVVCKMRTDSGMKKRSGKIVKRTCYDFNFQGGTEQHKKQRSPKDIDVFYHVLSTQYRTLIWETPTNVVSLRKNGDFVSVKNPNLDRNSIMKLKPDIDFSKYLVYTQYDPIIFQKFPEFFKKPVTLDQFFTS